MLGYKWKRARLSLKRKRNKDEFELRQGQIVALNNWKIVAILTFISEMKVILDLHQICHTRDS